MGDATHLGPYALGPGDTETMGVVTGDARVLSKAVPNESVAAILCDPIYWRIDDYAWLAQLAMRVLRPGGSVVAQAGAAYRYEAERVMREASNLTPGPMLAEVYALASGYLYKYGISIGWKAHLWFYKGPQRNGSTMFDRIYAGRTDKGLHRWSDDGRLFGFCIERLTNPGDIVLDPFTGSGAVPAVAKQLGRHWLAFEIDPDTAALARERIRNTQPPLFTLEPEQLALDLGGVEC